jgi:hypothetical protein
MLSVSKYKKPYFENCRTRFEEELKAYQALVKKAPGAHAAFETFEPHFCNGLVLALEGAFAHRTRALERKDGNPLNEVRMLSASILQNGGILTADKTINYDSEKSILKLKFGDEIAMTVKAFSELADAFFTEIKEKFVN